VRPGGWRTTWRRLCATSNWPKSPVQAVQTGGKGLAGRTLVAVPAETHTNQGPLDRNGVFELIRDQLADILETDPSSITEGASFVEDLDADSLALIELVEALEEELGERTVGFRINDEDLEDLRTVRDAVDYVYAKLEAG
jgi:acyl carrier protein